MVTGSVNCTSSRVAVFETLSMLNVGVLCVRSLHWIAAKCVDVVHLGAGSVLNRKGKFLCLQPPSGYLGYNITFCPGLLPVPGNKPGTGNKPGVYPEFYSKEVVPGSI